MVILQYWTFTVCYSIVEERRWWRRPTWSALIISWCADIENAGVNVRNESILTSCCECCQSETLNTCETAALWNAQTGPRAPDGRGRRWNAAAADAADRWHRNISRSELNATEKSASVGPCQCLAALLPSTDECKEETPSSKSDSIRTSNEEWNQWPLCWAHRSPNTSTASVVHLFTSWCRPR